MADYQGVLTNSRITTQVMTANEPTDHVWAAGGRKTSNIQPPRVTTPEEPTVDKPDVLTFATAKEPTVATHELSTVSMPETSGVDSVIICYMAFLFDSLAVRLYVASLTHTCL